jgi:hypothetical protein
MSRLIVYGDSYSTPGFCVEPKDSWWGLMAQDLQVGSIENYSWPGNNVDSISHLIVAGAGFSPEDYVVIGVPPIERFTVFDPDGQAPSNHRFFGNLEPMDQQVLREHDGLRQVTTHQLGQSYVMAWNRSWQEAQVLKELFLLKQYVQGWTPNVLLVNLAEPFQPRTEWLTLASIQRRFLADPHSILFDSTYYSVNKNINCPVDFDTHGWHGHHGPVGNKHWYETVLYPRIKQLGWIL